MERVCFVLQVRPDLIPAYKEAHRSVWPEMQDALRNTGWQNYSLFLKPDGLLIGYLETEDFEKALASMAALEVNEKWQRAMAGFFVNSEDGTQALPDRAMLRVEEVFHLDP